MVGTARSRAFAHPTGHRRAAALASGAGVCRV